MKQKLRNSKQYSEFSDYTEKSNDRRKQKERDRDRARREKYRTRSA